MADPFNTGGLFGSGTNAYAVGQFPTVHVPAAGDVRQWIPGQLRQAIVTGGAAGDHTVTGIGALDALVAVTRYVGAGVAVTDVADLTSEFTITAVDTINNTGGTDTTGDKLHVWWIARACTV